MDWKKIGVWALAILVCGACVIPTLALAQESSGVELMTVDFGFDGLKTSIWTQLKPILIMGAGIVASIGVAMFLIRLFKRFVH